MKKLFYFFISLILIVNSSSVFASESINKVISNSKIAKSAISVSVKNLKTGENVFSFNEDRPVNPASTQKLVTAAAAFDTLGKDYKFETKLYKSTNNELFLTLGADPYLSTADLKTLFHTAKVKNIITPKSIYIDDDIIDSDTWGEGWQWDDDLNPLMPKFGSYNIDDNLINIIIAPTVPNAPAKVYTEVFYPLVFMNLVTTGKTNNITISHNINISQDMLQVEGTVQNLIKKAIPVYNIKRYFRLRLEDAISDSKIEYYGKISEKKLPKQNVYLVEFVEHTLEKAITDILQNSNNMTAETVFKLAGGKYTGETGSTAHAIKMLEEFCAKQGLKTDAIKIVDGSGVSKNNLMTAEFMTDFLAAESKLENFETYREFMAAPGTGTLKDRMLYFKNNLRAKTGTLTDVSAIAGYIKTRRGNEYAFDIMISDPKSKPADKKMLEEYILRSIYENY